MAQGIYDKLEETYKLLSSLNKQLCCNPQTTTTTTLIPSCDGCWTNKNFSGTTFNNGDPIPQALNETDWLNAFLAETPIWAHPNYDPNNEPIYGRLYNWHVVNDPRGISPVGYHVPSFTEWQELITCLGGNEVAAGKMKTTGTLEANTGLWLAPNEGATNNMETCNECPFSALPAGTLRETGEHISINENASFWASTEFEEDTAYSVELYNNEAVIYPGSTLKGVGYSIRFKKDIC